MRNKVKSKGFLIIFISQLKIAVMSLRGNNNRFPNTINDKFLTNQIPFSINLTVLLPYELPVCI